MTHPTENKPLNPDQEFLAQIEAFLSEFDMGPSYFGKVASGNSELVRRLRDGKGCTLKTMSKAKAFMAARRSAKTESAA